MTNLSTSEDYNGQSSIAFIVSLFFSLVTQVPRGGQSKESAGVARTFPTAASPKSTSLTLLLGLGVFVLVDSDMAREPNEGDEGMRSGRLAGQAHTRNDYQSEG